MDFSDHQKKFMKLFKFEILGVILSGKENGAIRTRIHAPEPVGAFIGRCVDS